MKATLILKQDDYDIKTGRIMEESYILHMIGGSSSVQITPECESNLKFYKPMISLQDVETIKDQRVDVDIRDTWFKDLTVEDLDEIIYELTMLREQKLCELMYGKRGDSDD